MVFGVKDSLIKPLDYQEAGTTARGNRVDRPMAALRYDFVLADEVEAQGDRLMATHVVCRSRASR